MLARHLPNGRLICYGDDEVGQVSLVDNGHADLNFAYERDPRGNPTRITREDGSVVRYGYDAKSQLTSAGT